MNETTKAHIVPANLARYATRFCLSFVHYCDLIVSVANLILLVMFFGLIASLCLFAFFCLLRIGAKMTARNAMHISHMLCKRFEIGVQEIFLKHNG